MQKRIIALLSRQEARYILVGLTQLVLDWSLFIVLTAVGVPTALANVLGRVAIAMLGFRLHGRYTFGDADRSRLGWARFAKFAVTWTSLTTTSTLIMHFVRLNWGLYIAWAAKPFVELCIALVSYMLLKRWVYR